jgi:hypothetical protein
MHLLDSFERKIIFPLMRLIAILAIIALLIATAASIAGALIGPAGAQEQPAKELAAEPAEAPEGQPGIKDRASEIVIKIKEKAPDVQEVAVAAKGYAAGFLEQFREGVVFNTLATLNWMLSVVFVAAAAVLMGFFSLVLAFLAIERNTRKSE